jgi:hypothetical protein
MGRKNINIPWNQFQEIFATICRGRGRSWKAGRNKEGIFRLPTVSVPAGGVSATYAIFEGISIRQNTS